MFNKEDIKEISKDFSEIMVRAPFICPKTTFLVPLEQINHSFTISD